MMNDMNIRNADLREIVHQAKDVDAELLLKVIVVVDNAINILQRNQGNDTAIFLKRVIDVEAQIQSLRSELTHEREIRAKAELEQAERQVKQAKERLKLSTDAKLEVQKIFQDNLETAVATELDEAAEKRKAESEAWWRETGRAVVRAILIAVAVPVSLGLVVSIILFLAQVFKVSLP